jgi:transcription initiation factor TFIIIB Brf1 subunit/transcription initiation factor TFIIB
MQCDCNPYASEVCPNCGSHNLASKDKFINIGSVDAGKMPVATILPELHNMRYSEDIKIEITNLYNLVTGQKVRKGAPRKALIFGCIVQICKRSNLTVDINQLRETLGVVERQVNAAYLELNKALGPAFLTTSVADTIRTVMKTYGIREEIFGQIYYIYEQCRKILLKFNSARPETIASSVVYYYLKENLQDFDPESFFAKEKTSRETILAINDEINKVLKAQ